MGESTSARVIDPEEVNLVIRSLETGRIETVSVPLLIPLTPHSPPSTQTEGDRPKKLRLPGGGTRSAPPAAAPTSSPKSSASGAVARESPRITADPIILGDRELQDTENFVGCYAAFEGQIGLSFKGLPQAICVELKGRSYEAQPGTFQPLNVSSAFATCMRGLLQIWHDFHDLIRLESVATVDHVLESARRQLNSSYDRFVARYGTIHDNASLFHLDGIEDTRLLLLRGLEEADTHEKARLFCERTHFPPAPPTGQLYFDEEVSERLIKAYAKTLNDLGQIDIERIAMLSGVDAVFAEQTLVDLDVIVREPILPEQSGCRDIIRN